MARIPKYPSLDRYVSFQQRSATRGAAGGQSDVWIAVPGLPANVAANRMDEPGTRYDSNVSGSQVNNMLRTYFTVRWNPVVAAFDATQRISHEGREWKMCGQPVEPPGFPRRSYLQFFCEAGAAKT